MFQGHLSSAEIWRGSAINRRGLEVGGRGREGWGRRKCVPKSRALAGLFRGPFLTIKTRAGAKCAGLGPHVPAPANPHHHVHQDSPWEERDPSHLGPKFPGPLG